MSIFVASTLALLTLAVVVLGLALLSLMRQVGTVLLHVAPPRPGKAGGPEPGVDLPEKLRESVAGGSGGILVFLGAHCPACRRVEPVLPTLVAHYPELSVVPIVVAETQTQRDEHLETLKLAGRSDCQELIDAWQIPGTPYAVAVNAQHEVTASGVVNSLDQLEALAGNLVGDLVVNDLSSDAEDVSQRAPVVA